MLIECPRCHITYVDPSPAAAAEPVDCPWCGNNAGTSATQPHATEEESTNTDGTSRAPRPSRHIRQLRGVHRQLRAVRELIRTGQIEEATSCLDAALAQLARSARIEDKKEAP